MSFQISLFQFHKNSLSESRGKGYAEKCVITLIDELKRLGKENIFVMTEDPKLSGYYEKIGFKKSGEWGKCTNG